MEKPEGQKTRLNIYPHIILKDIVGEREVSQDMQDEVLSVFYLNIKYHFP